MSSRVWWCAAAAAVLAVSCPVRAQEAVWKLVPTVDMDQKSVKDYEPTFEKHFKVEGDTLVGVQQIGKEFFEQRRVDTLAGVGTIWATRADWPADLSDFEMTFEYKWEMPGKNFGDCPFLKAGFRLDGKGLGYSIWVGGYSAPVILQRIQSDSTVPVGRGQYKEYAQGGWNKLRVRAVGPYLKVKVWKAGKPEPGTWTAEAYDDWSASPGDTWRRGRVALGFSGIKVFDTATHHFRNVEIRPLSAETVKSEVLLDPTTGAPYVNWVDKPGTLHEEIARNRKSDIFENPKPLDTNLLAACTRDGNVSVETGPEGWVLRSTDGEPAFVWLPANPQQRIVACRVRSSPGARPLLALRAVEKPEGSPRVYLDPAWRPGAAAILYQGPGHTGQVLRFQWKDDTWYDLSTLRWHVQTWQIVERGGTDARATLSYGVGRGKESVGVGAAGKGTVTVKAVGLLAQ